MQYSVLVLLVILTLSIFTILPRDTNALSSGISLSGTVTPQGCERIEGTILADSGGAQNTKIEICKYGNKYLKIAYYEACLEMLTTWTDPDTGKTYGFPDSCGPPRLFAEGWKIYLLSHESQIFKIPYKITNGDLKGAEVDSGFASMILFIDTKDIGTIEITIPRQLVDPGGGLEEDEFIVLVDGEEISEKKGEFEEVNSSPCSRTLLIKLPAGSEEIEAIANTPFERPEYGRSLVNPVYIATDKNNYEVGETIIISGCTTLALDDKVVVGEILGPEGRRYSSMTSELMIDGSFSIPVGLEHLNAVNGTYTATVKYAGHSASTAFVVPEFPMLTMVIFATAVSLILTIRLKRNTSF